jgi:hypothetical protein
MSNPNYRYKLAGLALFVLAATLLTGCADNSRFASFPPASTIHIVFVNGDAAQYENLFDGQTRSITLKDGTMVEVATETERPYRSKVTIAQHGQQPTVTEGGWAKYGRVWVSGGIDVFIFEPQGESYNDLEQKMKKAKAYLASRRIS